MDACGPMVPVWPLFCVDMDGDSGNGLYIEPYFGTLLPAIKTDSKETALNPQISWICMCGIHQRHCYSLFPVHLEGRNATV